MDLYLILNHDLEPPKPLFRGPQRPITPIIRPTTPKQKSQSTTRDDRLMIYGALLCGVEPIIICQRLNITKRQLYYTQNHQLTPQHKKSGRPALLSADRI